MTVADVVTGILGGLIGVALTLLGVIFAFGLTLEHDRNKKKAEEKETRIRIAKAIRLELEANLKIVGMNREKQAREQKTGLLILFPSGAYLSALNGGFLSLFDPQVQYDLGATYTEFKWVETVSARVLSMMGGVDMSMSNYADNMKAFQVIIDKQMERLQEEIPQVLKDMESELMNAEEKRHLMGSRSR